MGIDVQHQPSLGAIGTAARYAGTGMRLERERQFAEREAGRREQAREFDEQMDFRQREMEFSAEEAAKAREAAAAQQQAAIAATKEQTDLARKQARELADMGDTRARDLADKLDTRARDLSAKDIAAAQKRIEFQLAGANDANEAQIIGEIGKLVSGIEASEAQLKLELNPAAAKRRKQAMVEFEKYYNSDSPVNLSEAAHLARKLVQTYVATNAEATAALTSEEKWRRQGGAVVDIGDGRKIVLSPKDTPTRILDDPKADGAVTPKMEAEQKTAHTKTLWGLVGKVKEEVWDDSAQAFRKVYYTPEDVNALMAGPSEDWNDVPGGGEQGGAPAAARQAPVTRDYQGRYHINYEAAPRAAALAVKLNIAPDTVAAMFALALRGDQDAIAKLNQYGFGNGTTELRY